MNRAYFTRILMSPEATEGNGSTAQDKPAPQDGGDRTAASLEKMLARYGSMEAVNRRLIEERMEDRETINRLKAKQPPEGAVILQGDEAKTWHEYQQLGPVGKLRETLEQGQKAAKDYAELQGKEIARKAAQAHGYKPEAFELVADKVGPLRIEEQWKGRDGKAEPRKVALVVSKGDDDKTTETPLDEVIEARFPTLLPALKPEPLRLPTLPPRAAAPNGIRTPQDENDRAILAALPRI